VLEHLDGKTTILDGVHRLLNAHLRGIKASVCASSNGTSSTPSRLRACATRSNLDVLDTRLPEATEGQTLLTDLLTNGVDRGGRPGPKCPRFTLKRGWVKARVDRCGRGCGNFESLGVDRAASD
jgi:hypothetical protein